VKNTPFSYNTTMTSPRQHWLAAMAISMNFHPFLQIVHCFGGYGRVVLGANRSCSPFPCGNFRKGLGASHGSPPVCISKQSGTETANSFEFAQCQLGLLGRFDLLARN